MSQERALRRAIGRVCGRPKDRGTNVPCGPGSALTRLRAESREQVVGGGLETPDIAEGPGDEHGPLETAHDRARFFERRSGKAQRSVVTPLL